MNRYIASLTLGMLTALAVTTPALATDQLSFSMDSAPAGHDQAGHETAGHWTSGCLPDAAQPHDDACVAVDGKGDLARIQRAGGGESSPALKFPMKGRAMLTVPHTPRLNPGTADFTVSAIVRLARSEVTPGANVVQKGNYDTPVGQWKLQVDRGVPSCRIAGMRDGRLVSLLVRWPRSVAGTGWQQITCSRRGDTFSISVGTAAPTTVRGAAMDVGNTYPVTMGAKSTGRNNDQFRGSVDEVSFQVG